MGLTDADHYDRGRARPSAIARSAAVVVILIIYQVIPSKHSAPLHPDVGWEHFRTVCLQGGSVTDYLGILPSLENWGQEGKEVIEERRQGRNVVSVRCRNRSPRRLFFLKALRVDPGKPQKDWQNRHGEEGE